MFLVEVFDTGTTSVVYPDIQLTDSNTVTLTFFSAPTINQFKVLVLQNSTVGGGGGTGFTYVETPCYLFNSYYQ